MPIHPDTINAAGLRRRWRGYDRRQVEALLHQIGQDYDAALDTIAELGDDRGPGGAATNPVVTDSATPAAARQRHPVQHGADSARQRPAEQQPTGTNRPDEQDSARAPSGAPSLPPHREPATEHLRPPGTAGRERVEEIEAELARLRARLSLIERICQLEDELKALRAAAVPPEAPRGEL